MVARQGLEIEYRVGDRAISAYVATPHSGTGPGVLVIHDGRGLNGFARDVCDRLARADFVALAPDLLNGRQATRAEQADRHAKELDHDDALAILDAGVVELFNQHGTDGKNTGVLGFGMGGQLALALGGQNARIGAVADFYGWHPRVEPQFETFDAPVLAIFAGEEQEPEATYVERLGVELAAAGVRCSVQTREGLHAGFMDDARPDVHDAVAEAECWDALLAFFRAEVP